MSARPHNHAFRLSYKLDQPPPDAAEMIEDADVSRLFYWTICHVVHGRRYEKGLRVFEKVAGANLAPKSARNHVRLHAQLALLAELHGNDPKPLIERGVKRLSECVEADLGEDKTHAVELGVAMALRLGAHEEAAAWRRKRLSLDMYERSAAVSFEVLYLSSKLVGEDSLTDLGLAAIRLVDPAAPLIGFLSAAPGLLALAGLASARSKSLRELLWDRVDELDELAFGSSRDPGHRLEIGAPEWHEREGADGTESVARLAVTGTGRLSPMAYPLPPFWTGVSETFRDLQDRERRVRSEKGKQETKAIQEVVFAGKGSLAIELRLAPEIELGEEHRLAYELRARVALEYAATEHKALVELRPIHHSIAAGARVEVQQAAAKPAAKSAAKPAAKSAAKPARGPAKRKR
jgi:hypothetical protein